jgi:hypothetical protein
VRAKGQNCFSINFFWYREIKLYTHTWEKILRCIYWQKQFLKRCFLEHQTMGKTQKPVTVVGSVNISYVELNQSQKPRNMWSALCPTTRTCIAGQVISWFSTEKSIHKCLKLCHNSNSLFIPSLAAICRMGYIHCKWCCRKQDKFHMANYVLRFLSASHKWTTLTETTSGKRWASLVVIISILG